MERNRTSETTACNLGGPPIASVPRTQTSHHRRWLAWTAILCLAVQSFVANIAICQAGGGVLLIDTEDETTRTPVPARLELFRDKGKPQLVRGVPSGGRGVIVSKPITLTLADGTYPFRFTRGPEYRIIQGNFTLERTSDDSRIVALPRMVDMQAAGWLSCDMAIPPGTDDVRLRMMAEDLHVAAVIDELRPPRFPNALPEDTTPFEPIVCVAGNVAVEDGDVIIYPAGDTVVGEWLDVDETARVAIANPFAFALPVWIATQRVDGVFVLGDWLRDDKSVTRIDHGRRPQIVGFDNARGPGRYAELVYWNLLECGLRLVPLAGTGTRPGGATTTAIGYNRVYASIGEVTQDHDAQNHADAISAAVWAGASVITNGPMLRPTLDGFPPGHVFRGVGGDKLALSMAIDLSVRDEVDYLEIIVNGKSFYNARLDEFARAGGVFPLVEVDQSSWVIVRVVTRHEDHYRMATSAPWFVDFDDLPRISRKAVEFFREWLVDAETELKILPTEALSRYVPLVGAARRYWAQRADDATVD